jgi:hypothetical protein
MTLQQTGGWGILSTLLRRRARRDSVMIRGIIYIIVFAAGFSAGGLFPSFSAQYHQRLQAQYDQVSIDLAPFQHIADRFHGGSLDGLVQHHLNSTDPTFHAEGEAIQLMIDSQARLVESKAAAQATYVDQAVYLYQHRDRQVVQATWKAFTPSMVTSENAITFSLTITTAAILLLWGIWSTLGLALRAGTTKRT